MQLHPTKTLTLCECCLTKLEPWSQTPTAVTAGAAAVLSAAAAAELSVAAAAVLSAAAAVVQNAILTR